MVKISVTWHKKKEGPIHGGVPHDLQMHVPRTSMYGVLPSSAFLILIRNLSLSLKSKERLLSL